MIQTATRDVGYLTKYAHPCLLLMAGKGGHALFGRCGLNS